MLKTGAFAHGAREHRTIFLEATVVNFLVLSWIEANYKLSGNVLRGCENAKAITATTIDKLTTDYADLKDSVDLMLTHLDHELHKIVGIQEKEVAPNGKE